VRKADPATFESLNDGFFGRDKNSVFWGGYIVKKARVEHWQKIGGPYSKDDKRIFIGTDEFRSADYDTFEVVSADVPSLARDKNNLYMGDEIVDAELFEKILDDETL
jgi:hypothetical protein